MLVTCSECGAKISSECELCPKCGRPYAGRESEQVRELAKLEAEKAIKEKEGALKEWDNFIRNLGCKNCIKIYCPHCGKERLCEINKTDPKKSFSIVMVCTKCQREFLKSMEEIKTLCDNARKFYWNSRIPRGSRGVGM